MAQSVFVISIHNFRSLYYNCQARCSFLTIIFYLLSSLVPAVDISSSINNVRMVVVSLSSFSVLSIRLVFFNYAACFGKCIKNATSLDIGVDYSLE